MKTIAATATTRVATVLVILAILAGAAPAIANATDTAALPFTTTLAAAPAPVKFTAATTATTALSTASVKALATVPVKTTAATTASSGTTAVKRAATSDELAQAKAILAGLTARYPILQGTTVSFGDARGYQAIALYKSGRIIISTTHTASLERIMNHEVWHIIDWRDNGQIDWGENVPPKS